MPGPGCGGWQGAGRSWSSMETTSSSPALAQLPSACTTAGKQEPGRSGSGSVGTAPSCLAPVGAQEKLPLPSCQHAVEATKAHVRLELGCSGPWLENVAFPWP